MASLGKESKKRRAAEPGGTSKQPAKAVRVQTPWKLADLREVKRIASRIRTRTGSSYLRLVKQFPLLIIETKGDFEAAVAVLDRLLTKADLDKGENTYLNQLATLISDYEEANFTVDSPTDAAMLQHLMEGKSVRAVDVARGAGISKSAISKILSGRAFSKNEIAKLAEYFGVSKAVLSGNLGVPAE